MLQLLGHLALTPGAVSVAEFTDLNHLCAYQVHNGHTGVGINAYVGDFAPGWTGPFGTVVVNARQVADFASLRLAYADTNCDSYGYSYGYADSNRNTYCDGNSYGDSHSDCNGDAHSYCAAEVFAHATASADAAEHLANCYFNSSDCTGFAKTVTLTCIDCLVTQGGTSFLDFSGCHTTCPSP